MNRKLFFLPGVILVSVLSGCSTVQPPSATHNLQIKVAQLERKLLERDQELEDLKYDMKELAVRVESEVDYRSNIDPIQEPPTSTRTSAKYSASSATGKKEDLRIIRVAVAPQKLQGALKNAGYYEGAIDGKIGSKSRQAIKDFQKGHELTTDGIVGRKTWLELKNYLSD